MAKAGSKAGSREDIAEIGRQERELRPLAPGLDEDYLRYVAGVKRLGGKAIATPQEYSEIQKRLAKLQIPSVKARQKGYRVGGNYAEYMRRTAQPSLEGVKGEDLEEARRVLYGK